MKIKIIYRPGKNVKREKGERRERERKRSKNLAYRARRRFMFHVKRNYWLIKKRPWWKILFIILCNLFLLMLAAAVISSPAIYYMFCYTGDLVGDDGRPLDFEKLARSDFKKTSCIYAADRKTIIGRSFEEDRNPVKIKEIPDVVKQAFVAAEDQRFYSRWQFGIDPIATFRAAGVDLFHKATGYGKVYGASGIPQQLARLLYAEERQEFKDRERSFWRKVREAKVAIQLVRRYPKDKILEGFLNLIYFGNGVNGVAEASLRYFGKDLKELGLREAIILASLNKSPSLYSPIYRRPKEPELKGGATKETWDKYETALAKENARIIEVRKRYNWVLDRMQNDGYISLAQKEAARFNDNEPLQAKEVRLTPLKDPRFGHVSRFVKEILLSTGHDDEELSYYGGLRIITTIDPRIQEIANVRFSNHMAVLNGELPPDEEKLDGSVVILDVESGDIVALIGGLNPQGGKPFDRALARRSPGSGAKPFVYATAIEKFHKDFYDKICNCPFNMKGANGKRWAPRNFPEKKPVPLGYNDMAIGIIKSLNLETLQLARMIGMESIIETYHQLGAWGQEGILKDSDGNIIFKRPGVENDGTGLDPRLPTAIGASGVNLVELTSAYNTLARGGSYIRPRIIKEIRDSEDNVLYRAPATEGRQVLSEETARKMTMLLRAVTKMGTLQITMKDTKQQAAAKTGTSNGPDDLGVYGYTGYKPRGIVNNINLPTSTSAPSYTIAVRIGYDHPHAIDLPQYMLRASHDPTMHISAGWVVGSLWKEIAETIYENRPKSQFPPEVEDGTHELLKHYGKDMVW